MTATTPSHARTAKRLRLAGWLSGDGVEIGALHRPLPLPPGVHVRYVDRMSVSELRSLYPELAGDELVPVDIIGDVENLSNIADDSLDFVIASHLLEHLTLPVRGLREMLRVLKPNGVLYLIVPDQRVGIDHSRTVTPVRHLIESLKAEKDTRIEEHYRDWVVNAEKTPGDLVKARIRELSNMRYPIHFHTFRPDTLLLFLLSVRKDAGIAFDIAAFAPGEYPNDDDIIVVLVKGSHHEHPPLPPRSLDLAAVPRSTVNLGGVRNEWRRLMAAAHLRAARSRLRPVLAPVYRSYRQAREALPKHRKAR